MIYGAGRPLGAVKAVVQQPTVAFSATNATVAESAGSTQPVVVLSVPGGGSLTCPVTVTYQTTDGTARGGADFTRGEGTVTFAAGRTNGATENIPAVAITADALDEIDETFAVDLTAATGATIGAGGRMNVTITDDDPTPVLTVADVIVNEGNSGTTTAVFTATLSAISGRDVHVTYATANELAQAGLDYAATSGVLTIPAGQQSATISVIVYADTLAEGWERFALNLTQPVACTLARPTAWGRIRDDDVTRKSDDFNNDGMRDLIWQHANGNVEIWFMSGTVRTGTHLLSQGATDWQLVGSGDPDRDGDTDLYWWNQITGQLSVWVMNGTTLVSAQPLLDATTQQQASATLDWKVRSIADMNLDGSPDVVWQNTTTGQLAAWFMNGLTLPANQSLLLQPDQVSDLAWVIVGAGDANGDSFPDLYWHNRSTGQLGVWLMQERTLIAGHDITPGVSDTTWQVRGIGDMDNNGSPDLLWQRTVSPYDVAAWLMNGLTLLGGYSLTPPTVPDSGWRLAIPK